MSPEKRFYISCTDCYIGHRPIPDGTEVFKPNRYTTYQSPLLPGETLSSGFFNQCSESFTQDLSEVTLAGKDSAQDFTDVPLAYEDLPRRAAPSSGAC